MWMEGQTSCEWRVSRFSFCLFTWVSCFSPILQFRSIETSRVITRGQDIFLSSILPSTPPHTALPVSVCFSYHVLHFYEETSLFVVDKENNLTFAVSRSHDVPLWTVLLPDWSFKSFSIWLNRKECKVSVCVSDQLPGLVQKNVSSLSTALSKFQ